MRRYLQLTITGPIDITDLDDPPSAVEGATLEFDLVKGTVKLPGGFTCSLMNLLHIIDRARMAQREYRSSLFANRGKTI